MKMRTMMVAMVALVIGSIGFAAFAASDAKTEKAGPVGVLVLGGGVLGMAVLPSVKDAGLKLTRALPASNTTVYSLPFDTEVTPNGVQPRDVEYLLTAPALAVGQLSDAATAKYSILLDTVAPIDGSSVARHTDCIVQTGAAGAGSAGATYRFKLPSDATRILGFKIVTSANVDASAASATLEALF